MEKVFRNVYFYGSAMKSGNGTVDVYYTGKKFNNAKNIKGFDRIFDKSQDLYIICGSCALKKYRNFIRVKLDE